MGSVRIATLPISVPFFVPVSDAEKTELEMRTTGFCGVSGTVPPSARPIMPPTFANADSEPPATQ